MVTKIVHLISYSELLLAFTLKSFRRMKVQWCHALGAQNFLMEGQEHQLVHKQQEQYCLFTDAAEKQMTTHKMFLDFAL